MSKIRPKDRRQLSQGMVRFTNPKLKEFGKIINCGQPCLQSGTARPHKQCTLESSMSQPGAANQNGQTGGMDSELWTFCHPSSEIGRPNTRLGSALLSRAPIRSSLVKASQVGGEEGCLKTREAMSDIGVREVVPQVCRTGQPQVPTASRRPKGTSDFTAYLRSTLPRLPRSRKERGRSALPSEATTGRPRKSLRHHHTGCISSSSFETHWCTHEKQIDLAASPRPAPRPMRKLNPHTSAVVVVADPCLQTCSISQLGLLLPHYHHYQHHHHQILDNLISEGRDQAITCPDSRTRALSC